MSVATSEKKVEKKSTTKVVATAMLRFAALVLVDALIYKGVTKALGYDTGYMKGYSNSFASVNDLTTKGRRTKGLGYILFGAVRGMMHSKVTNLILRDLV